MVVQSVMACRSLPMVSFASIVPLARISLWLCCPARVQADFSDVGKPRKLLDFAPSLWSSDYRPFLQAEDLAAQAALDMLPQSSYRQRLTAEAAAAYDAKALKRARSAVGMLARVANTRAWTFSVVARSLSWFNQRVPHRVWADACEDRYVASRPRCLELLHEMRRVEPQPAWIASPNVFVFAADQTYCWQGCQKRGRARQGAERTDSTGMPLIIRSEVYVNSVRFHVPFKLCDLSRGELAELEQGPYTKAWEAVLPALQPRAVERGELELQLELNALVLAAMGATPAADVSLRTIMLALLSHPPNDPGGPTPMEWQEVLQKCSTQSYEDLRRIIAHGWDNANLANPTVMVLFGDGQTALRGRDTKRKFPQFHRKVLLGVGPFHQMAHFLFCAICGYWWCLVCCCCLHLGITKVGPNMKDLEHSNYEHAFTIIRVITVAIYATIVQDVTDPPPQLFLTNPDAYLARVNSGGAVVLLQFLRHVGIPSLQWQRAARSGEGHKLVKLMAIALHSFRCFQYKVGCAQISMLALVSYLCVHDKLAAVVFAYSGVCSRLAHCSHCHLVSMVSLRPHPLCWQPSRSWAAWGDAWPSTACLSTSTCCSRSA